MCLSIGTIFLSTFVPSRYAHLSMRRLLSITKGFRRYRHVRGWCCQLICTTESIILSAVITRCVYTGTILRIDISLEERCVFWTFGLWFHSELWQNDASMAKTGQQADKHGLTLTKAQIPRIQQRQIAVIIKRIGGKSVQWRGLDRSTDRIHFRQMENETLVRQTNLHHFLGCARTGALPFVQS